MPPFSLLDGEEVSLRDNGVKGNGLGRSLVERADGSLALVDYTIDPTEFGMMEGAQDAFEEALDLAKEEEPLPDFGLAAHPMD